MLAAMMLFSAVAAQGPCAAEAGVHHDASARALVLRTAARDLPAPTGAGQYGSHHGHGKVSPLARFAWPADGWARGFRVRILDCAGTELGRVPRLHHALVLHLSRRELLYPVTARLMAIGQETDDVILPRGVGLRLAAGDSLGFLVSWGAGEQGPERVMLEVTIPYLPARANPRPTDVIPFGFDVRYAPETGNAFDLPPGRSEHTREFVMPIDGHVLAAGGHLHDYAVSLELIDTESGRTARTLRGRRSPGPVEADRWRWSPPMSAAPSSACAPTASTAI